MDVHSSELRWCKLLNSMESLSQWPSDVTGFPIAKDIYGNPNSPCLFRAFID